MKALTRYIPTVCAVITGLIFLCASVTKIANPADFSLSVFRYHILPQSLVNLAALFLPWLEFSCALCAMVSPKMRKSALLILLALLVLFTGAITLNIMRGTSMACGCFSVSPLARPLGWLNVLRNLGLIALTLIALGWFPCFEMQRRKGGKQ